MSTIGLEPKNFINPNLAWKKMSKVRRMSRHPRRHFSKNLKKGQHQGNKSPKPVEVPPQALESGKHDVALSWRQLSDNIGHIPIKKRRFLLRSPSPPLRTPCCPNESEKLDKGTHESDWKTYLSSAAEGENVETGSSDAAETESSIDISSAYSRHLESTGEMHGCDEDFSGIAILADVACRDGLENSADADERRSVDEFLCQEKIKSAPAMNTNETTECLEMSYALGKVHSSIEGSVARLLNDDSNSIDCVKARGESPDCSHNVKFENVEGGDILKESPNFNSIDDDNRGANSDHSLSLQSDNVKTRLSADDQNTLSAKNSIEMIREKYASDVKVFQAENLPVKMSGFAQIKNNPCEVSCQSVEKGEVALLHASGSGKKACETNNVDIKGHQKRNDRNNGEKEYRGVSFKPGEQNSLVGDIVTNGSKLKKIGIFCCRNKSEVMTLQNQVDTPANCSHNAHLEDCLNGDLNSLVSREDYCQAEITTELQRGYDSHLEDGELRESDVLFLNEGGTDGTKDFVLSMGKLSVGVDADQRSSLSHQFGYSNDHRLTSEKITGESSCRSCPESLSTADAKQTEYLKRKSRIKGLEEVAMNLKAGTHEGINDHEEVDVAGRKLDVGSDGSSNGENDASENDSNIPTRMSILRAPRRVLQSQIEGPVSSDRKDADFVRRGRSSNFHYMYGGKERRTGSDDSFFRGRSSLHLDSRNRLGNHPWNFDLNTDGERSFRASYDNMRKSLSGERDDEHTFKAGDISQGRFERYPFGMSRDFREGYRRPGIHKNTCSPGIMPNHFGNRERDFVIFSNRFDHPNHSYRRSRLRPSSCSPDFRSRVGTRSVRRPYQPVNHEADHMRDGRSPSRMFSQEQGFQCDGLNETI
ncbi:hypothetical protein Nepgr_020226 [Nepenthes gracilis]|uniref:Uncharacterized protein n=1 Tax=Nepenthes gracilis TaxID=150966 RepID=A0AAD3SWG5_NEPGR|nr:hypothetical protein Nepgr_020226 [Nepenthes gracilis]